VDLGIGTAEQLLDMRLNGISEKSRAVLKALAKVRSYVEALVADRTLTVRDVFRALSESPTGFWDKSLTPKRNNEHVDPYLCSMMLKKKN